jgi:hypothetical protein
MDGEGPSHGGFRGQAEGPKSPTVKEEGDQHRWWENGVF